jgi:hypothetical protein
VGADSVEVLDGARVVAAHARLVVKASESLVLDHYLEVLRLKPGALPGGHRPGPGEGLGCVRRRARAVLDGGATPAR